MNTINHILKNIKSLTFPELFIEIERLGLKNTAGNFIRPLRKNGEKERIYRARPTRGKIFNHVSQLSYNPWPNKIDRASTPCSPMFYGAISANENDYPILTNFSELNQILRSKSLEYDEQEIAIAEFEVKEDFLAAGIIFCEKFLKKNKQYVKLYEEVKQNSMHDFNILTDFSNMFSYTEKDKYYDNRITATFMHFLLANNEKIDAIIYPSARLEGEGTNIAIHPQAVKDKLICKRVLITKAYMDKGYVIYDEIKKADTINTDGSFELIDIKDPRIHLGRELCLRTLYETIEHDK
ncbi:MAG: RES domain-containing protein [Chlorobi bacterium]|nr:RES domain-containing protein [Chlorobiota bacterium]